MLADCTVCNISGPAWMAAYLKACGDSLDAISYDFYPKNSLDYRWDVDAAEAMLQPKYHDIIRQPATTMQELRDKHAPHAQLWMTETASFSGGGIQNVSDRFASGFWYIAQLGYLVSPTHARCYPSHCPSPTPPLAPHTAPPPR